MNVWNLCQHAIARAGLTARWRPLMSGNRQFHLALMDLGRAAQSCSPDPAKVLVAALRRADAGFQRVMQKPDRSELDACAEAAAELEAALWALPASQRGDVRGCGGFSGDDS